MHRQLTKHRFELHDVEADVVIAAPAADAADAAAAAAAAASDSGAHDANHGISHGIGPTHASDAAADVAADAAADPACRRKRFRRGEDRLPARPPGVLDAELAVRNPALFVRSVFATYQAATLPSIASAEPAPVLIRIVCAVPKRVFGRSALEAGLSVFILARRLPGAPSKARPKNCERRNVNKKLILL